MGGLGGERPRSRDEPNGGVAQACGHAALPPVSPIFDPSFFRSLSVSLCLSLSLRHFFGGCRRTTCSAVWWTRSGHAAGPTSPHGSAAALPSSAASGTSGRGGRARAAAAHVVWHGRAGVGGETRWHNHLNPDVNKLPWTADEDIQIRMLHAKLGNRWAEIAKHMSGR